MPPADRIAPVVALRPTDEARRRHPAGHHPAAPPAVSWAPRGDTASVVAVRCPSCASLDDKVIDSRMSDDGASIRRRRACLTCGRRFTTFERLEELPLLVVKRSGDRVPFDRSKIEAGIRAAAKGRPLDDAAIAALVDDVEEAARVGGAEVTSEQLGLAVLDALRDVDQVAYVRFASVYKGFDDAADFQRELRLLKATAPKRH